METKRLISERSEISLQLIQDARYKAALWTKLIEAYNAIPIVATVETAEQAKKFLSGPMAFLEERLLEDTGVSFKGAKPKAWILASMFEINFEGFRELVQHSSIGHADLSLFSFDELTKKVELMPGSEEVIREQSRIYISDTAEIELFNRVQKLADEINQICPEFRIDGTDLHRVPSSLRFFAVTGKKGGGWELSPDYSAVKKAAFKVKINN